jgi:hypothetical protein
MNILLSCGSAHHGRQVVTPPSYRQVADFALTTH